QRGALVDPARYLLTGDAERAQEPVERGARRQRLPVRVVATKVGIELPVGEPVHDAMTPVQRQPGLPDPGDAGDDADRQWPLTRAVARCPRYRGEVVERIEFRAAPDEPPDVGRELPWRRLPQVRSCRPRHQIAWPGGRCARAPGRLVTQQGLVDGAQLRPGLDAQRL